MSVSSSMITWTSAGVNCVARYLTLGVGGVTQPVLPESKEINAYS